MSITQEQVGVNPDGTPHINYTYACDHGCEADGGACTGGLLVTGPISGTIGLSDGTLYSVTPDCIEVAPGHHGPLVHHIEKMHEKANTFPGFSHVCVAECGAEADAPVVAS
jgi:hypothetical protein